MSISTDTHDYDNTLLFKTKKNITEEDKSLFLKTIIQILRKLKEHKNYIEPYIFENVKNTLKLFVIDAKNNIDNINKIRLEILLPLVWGKVKNKDNSILYVFFEQLSDIYSSGSLSTRKNYSFNSVLQNLLIK